MDESVELLKLLIEEGRKLSTGRAVKLRQTLRIKGKRKDVYARRDRHGRIVLKAKSPKDIIRNKVKALRAKHKPIFRKKKQRRAFKLSDRGIRA
jgi:hypothetical protein